MQSFLRFFLKNFFLKFEPQGSNCCYAFCYVGMARPVGSRTVHDTHTSCKAQYVVTVLYVCPSVSLSLLFVPSSNPKFQWSHRHRKHLDVGYEKLAIFLRRVAISLSKINFAVYIHISFINQLPAGLHLVDGVRL